MCRWVLRPQKAFVMGVTNALRHYSAWMIRLHINVDHVATVRNARGTRYPDPIFAAQQCELAGADGITIHLREDRRHILDRDVERMREAIQTTLNLEMAATDEMIEIAERVGPDVITLVPERREERTTEGGLDAMGHREAIRKVSSMCERRGIRLSLFLAADADQIRASRNLGAGQIELHTGDYCELSGSGRTTEWERLARGSELAAELGLEVAAGHGLTRANVIGIAAIPAVEELNIGHAVIADALFVGMGEAVKGFREAVARGEAQRSTDTHSIKIQSVSSEGSSRDE